MSFRASITTGVGAGVAEKVFEAVAGDVEVSVTAQGTGTFYLGGDSTVSSANGFARPISTGQVLQLRVRPGDELWAFSTSGNCTVYVLARSA